jgi:hypothetical protein
LSTIFEYLILPKSLACGQRRDGRPSNDRADRD